MLDRGDNLVRTPWADTPTHRSYGFGCTAGEDDLTRTRSQKAGNPLAGFFYDHALGQGLRMHTSRIGVWTVQPLPDRGRHLGARR